MRCNKFGAKARCQSCSALCLFQIERVEAVGCEKCASPKTPFASSVATTETLEEWYRAYHGNDAPDDLGRKSPQ
jgi:hypothetical protein